MEVLCEHWSWTERRKLAALIEFIASAPDHRLNVTSCLLLLPLDFLHHDGLYLKL